MIIYIYIYIFDHRFPRFWVTSYTFAIVSQVLWVTVWYHAISSLIMLYIMLYVMCIYIYRYVICVICINEEMFPWRKHSQEIMPRHHEYIRFSQKTLCSYPILTQKISLLEILGGRWVYPQKNQLGRIVDRGLGPSPDPRSMKSHNEGQPSYDQRFQWSKYIKVSNLIPPVNCYKKRWEHHHVLRGEST